MMADLRGARARVLACALVAALGLSAGCGPATPAWKGHPPARPTHVGALELPEVMAGSEARPFAFRAKSGGALLVYFGYVSCPDVCPTTMADVRRALRALGPDAARVEVAFATVDLNRDKPQVLLPFVRHFIANGHALVAERDEQLAAAEVAFGATSSVTRSRKGDVDVSHTGDLYLVDPRGDVPVVWRFGTKPADIAEDLRLFLAMEAQHRP